MIIIRTSIGLDKLINLRVLNDGLRMDVDD